MNKMTLPNIPCPYCNELTLIPYEAPVNSGRYWVRCNRPECGKSARAAGQKVGAVISITRVSKMGREPGEWTKRPDSRYLRLAVSNKLTAKQAQIILNNNQNVA